MADWNALIPFGDRVIANRDAPEKQSKGGIFIPEEKMARDKREVQVATILAVGPGRQTDSGAMLEMPFKVGDRVYFDKYAANEIKIDGVEYIALEQKAIICRLEK